MRGRARRDLSAPPCHGCRAPMKNLVGKPVLMDKLDAELVPKVVEAIIADNERAKKARESRRSRKAAAGGDRGDGSSGAPPSST